MSCAAPYDGAGFMLKPAGFFEQNPVMDVAPPRLRRYCCE
jgi:Cu2+-containing amine oxidase